jgi:hypothetical protein
MWGIFSMPFVLATSTLGVQRDRTNRICKHTHKRGFIVSLHGQRLNSPAMDGEPEKPVAAQSKKLEASEQEEPMT